MCAVKFLDEVEHEIMVFPDIIPSSWWASLPSLFSNFFFVVLLIQSLPILLVFCNCQGKKKIKKNDFSIERYRAIEKATAKDLSDATAKDPWDG